MEGNLLVYHKFMELVYKWLKNERVLRQLLDYREHLDGIR